MNEYDEVSKCNGIITPCLHELLGFVSISTLPKSSINNPPQTVFLGVVDTGLMQRRIA